MSILNFISDIFKPITGLISDLVTTDKERVILTNELVKIENEFTGKLLEYETKLLDAQSKIILAEAAGASWLQRSWRPITALTMLALVVCHYLGILAFPIADQAWTLLQISIGGYVAGRTVEKAVKEYKNKGN